MVIIPAIDLLDGNCVRLKQGNYDESTVYSGNPVETAKKFVGCGAERIHVVDLDAARGEGKNNRDKIASIRKAVTVPLEVGGGVRKVDDIRALLETGVDRLILGTVLAREVDMVAGWVREFGRVFIAGIDAKDGVVKVSGWHEKTPWSDIALARKAADIGIDEIIYTNIALDGMLAGPDIESTNKIAEAAGVSVILSGGIGSTADILEVYRSGISGVITGRALYDGRIDLQDAIKRLRKIEEQS
jgi:phosphoribosylformimino-5-aminoimidazole carboxamide ribotide isomerase